ncbi:MAG: hypothetical protein AAGB15_07715 [Pseudomonadota bacterium]
MAGYEDGENKLWIRELNPRRTDLLVGYVEVQNAQERSRAIRQSNCVAHQANRADAILIFLASTEAADEMIRDPMEQADVLLQRKSRWSVLTWFWWRVAGLAVSLIGRLTR